MGGKQSSTLVKESARVVVARKNAILEDELKQASELAARVAKQSANQTDRPIAAGQESTAAATTSATSATVAAAAAAAAAAPSSNNHPSVTTSPLAHTHSAFSSPTTASSSEPIQRDILDKISKWSVKSTPMTQAAPMIRPVSAAQIRDKRDFVADSKDPNAVPPGRLSELALHQLFKKSRDDGLKMIDREATVKELSVAHKLDEVVVHKLLQYGRLPTFYKDIDEPEVTKTNS